MWQREQELKRDSTVSSLVQGSSFCKDHWQNSKALPQKWFCMPDIQVDIWRVFTYSVCKTVHQSQRLKEHEQPPHIWSIPRPLPRVRQSDNTCLLTPNTPPFLLSVLLSSLFVSSAPFIYPEKRKLFGAGSMIEQILTFSVYVHTSTPGSWIAADRLSWLFKTIQANMGMINLYSQTFRK